MRIQGPKQRGTINLRVFVEDHNDPSWTHRGSLPEETEHILGTIFQQLFDEADPDELST